MRFLGSEHRCQPGIALLHYIIYGWICGLGLDLWAWVGSVGLGWICGLDLWAGWTCGLVFDFLGLEFLGPGFLGLEFSGFEFSGFEFSGFRVLRVWGLSFQGLSFQGLWFWVWGVRVNSVFTRSGFKV